MGVGGSGPSLKPAGRGLDVGDCSVEVRILTIVMCDERVKGEREEFVKERLRVSVEIREIVCEVTCEEVMWKGEGVTFKGTKPNGRWGRLTEKSAP